MAQLVLLLLLSAVSVISTPLRQPHPEPADITPAGLLVLGLTTRRSAPSTDAPTNERILREPRSILPRWRTRASSCAEDGQAMPAEVQAVRARPRLDSSTATSSRCQTARSEARRRVRASAARTSTARSGRLTTSRHCHRRRRRRLAVSRLHRRRRRRRRHRLGHPTWHDDLTQLDQHHPSCGNQRVSEFVDFVNGSASPTTITATVRMSPASSSATVRLHGRQAGMAPDAIARLAQSARPDGKGTISNIIAALDWVVDERARLQHPRRQPLGRRGRQRIRTGPIRSRSPPSARRSGIVVVAAAGNLGKNAEGEHQYGGISRRGTRPGCSRSARPARRAPPTAPTT